MRQLFNEELNTKKLELYLNMSTRGFILLQVNDKRYEKWLIDFVSSIRTTIAFDLNDADFRDGIEYLKSNKDVEVLLYYNLDSDNERLRNILEKINLSRDLLLVQDRINVFIVPQYIAFMMQDEFPNLYSYFGLKESYIKSYPFLFEYILPGGKYLVTKSSQNEFKQFFYSSGEGIEERLDYYSQKKVKQRELIRLKKDLDEYLSTFELKTDVYDIRYYYTLLLRMANVYTVQGECGHAIELYDEILKEHVIISQYPGIYYEAYMQKTDIFLNEKKYQEAIEMYEAIAIMIERQQEYGSSEVFFEYIIKLYPRIALCLAQVKKYQIAERFMRVALEMAKERKNYDECFAICYNRIILNAHMENKRNEIEILLEELKLFIRCDVQKALYFSVYAWYQGVVDGCLKSALKSAYSALVLKRENLLENDIRIAESHYLISVLYLLINETEQAKECKRKCVNILHNFESEKEKADMILKICK